MSESKHQTDGPDFEVNISGQAFEQGDTDGLTSLVVEDHVDTVGMMQATFNNRGVDWDSIKIGDKAWVEFGGGSDKAFEGFVTAIRHYWKEGTETVTITAMDPTVKLASSRVTKVYEEMSDSDIFEAVVGRAGVSVGKVDSLSTKHDYVFQRNESDLNFLKRLASRNGYLLMATNGKVDFLKPAFKGDTVEVPKGKLVQIDYEYTDQHLPPKLTVLGWDYVTKKMVTSTASSGDVDTMGGGSNAVSKTGQIWQAESFISDVFVSSESGAKAMAQGELNRLARNFMRGRATVNGTGEVKAGKSVKFTGQRLNFNPEGYVISVRHTVESTGLHQTQIIFCSNVHPG